MAKVCVFFANGFEEIEGLTVVDILRRAEIDTEMVSVEKELLVTGSHNIPVQMDVLFDNADIDGADMIVLPGGMPGTTNLFRHEGLRTKIKKFVREDKMFAAICAAPSILGANGVLEGKTAVCYPGFEEKLLGADVVFEKVVQDGNIITARGMGASIEFAAKIVEQFKGKEAAQKILEAIIY
ncbi:DJ-1 family glyoxalase III [Anaeromicropila populeti]|uniref:4-methyl-5(B-hydroxyethyl)-thiazole monophosphate biosynthesis n=1 Tax=Anaeromicropila populeti TaxID=37658 RepID=A0A1I6K0P9_9FIRM|nr:DJ-1 family glyoxalase III [Anaeromicropila populeti]SFR84803.1 4-methyl-5(b-hydroxyethyl)-thiazole monophosphate biosynthesis [Anaeromicropila populeti]